MVYIKEELFIDNKLKELEIAKGLIRNDPTEELQLFTHNFETGTNGVASFCLDDKTIKVFEGDGDGSDDKEMDYETFINNYDFCVAHEIEKIPLFIKI